MESGGEKEEGEREEEKKSGGLNLSSSCSFKSSKWSKVRGWSAFSFSSWPRQQTLQGDKWRGEFHHPRALNFKMRFEMRNLLKGIWTFVSPSTPILPSPSVSPAWRKVLVSASVRALADAEKFCRNSLEGTIGEKCWAFTVNMPLEYLTACRHCPATSHLKNHTALDDLGFLNKMQSVSHKFQAGCVCPVFPTLLYVILQQGRGLTWSRQAAWADIILNSVWAKERWSLRRSWLGDAPGVT